MSNADPSLTAGEQEHAGQIFSMTGDSSLSIADGLDEAIDALSALNCLFEGHRGDEFSPRETSGIWNILFGCIRSLESIKSEIDRVITDPTRAGLREGMKMSDGAYCRGFEEGQRAGIVETLALASVDGGAGVREELRRLAPHLIQKLKKDAPPDPVAATPSDRREAS